MRAVASRIRLPIGRRTVILSLLSSSLVACGDADTTPATLVETWREATELAPGSDGVYRLELAPSEVEIDGRRFCLRTFNGVLPGPTIRVPAGQDRKVRVDLMNAFATDDWRYIAGKEGSTDAHCNNFNLTNLHLHGSHIRPDYSERTPEDLCTGDGCGPDGRYHGDNVLIHVEPGEIAKYRWDLDEDGVHHEGTQWYHPHIHGTTAIQVTNGSAGAFIIEGPLDQIPEIAAAKERVMVMNQVPIDSELAKPLKDGETCSASTLSVNNFLSITEYMPTLINGVRVPRLVTPPGQVERWRFIHAGNPDELGLKLHKALDANCEKWDPLARIDHIQIARDGITLPQFFQTDTLWMSPGYRADMLVKMPETSETLCLVERRVRDLEGTAIAVIHVDERAGTPTSTTLPSESAIAATAPSTTIRGALGGVVQDVTCENTANRPSDQRVVLLVPETDSLDDDPIDKDLFAFACDPDTSGHHTPTGSDEDPNVLLPGDQSICQCPSPNINCRNFDDRRRFGYRNDRVMTADTVEQWEVTAFDGHPFHIHINPFLVCPTNSNKEPPFAHWRDTYWVQLEDGPRKILTHFKTFTGRFVLHCHKLNHEDEGMMEVIEICEPGDLDCLCVEDDGTSCTIPADGCLEEDKQCQFAKVATESYPAPPPPTPEICGPGTPPGPGPDAP